MEEDSLTLLPVLINSRTAGLLDSWIAEEFHLFRLFIGQMGVAHSGRR